MAGRYGVASRPEAVHPIARLLWMGLHGWVCNRNIQPDAPSHRVVPLISNRLSLANASWREEWMETTGRSPRDEQFWHGRWATGTIGFHEGTPNTLLVRHFETLSLAPGSRVFLPLCGKTRDAAWLLSNDYAVTGAELSRTAIEQLFADLNLTPDVTERGDIAHYRAERIDMFVGNVFDVTRAMIGAVDAVYDRAALVALPDDLRPRYTTHVTELAMSAPQLVITFEYDPDRMDGPPFSVEETHLRQYYGDRYGLHLAERMRRPGGLKGIRPAYECAWLLR